MSLLSFSSSFKVAVFLFAVGVFVHSSSLANVHHAPNGLDKSEFQDSDEEKWFETKSTVHTKKSKRQLRRQNKLNGKKWSKF